jgi:hypothetical protein
MTIRLNDRLAASLALTPEHPNAKPLGMAFNVSINPPLGPLASIRVAGDGNLKSFKENGTSLDLADASGPVLRNIAFGACELLAGTHEHRDPKRYVDDGRVLPVRQIEPSCHLRVNVGADLRSIVVEILEGKKSYEIAFKEGMSFEVTSSVNAADLQGGTEGGSGDDLTSEGDAMGAVACTRYGLPPDGTLAALETLTSPRIGLACA